MFAIRNRIRSWSMSNTVLLLLSVSVGVVIGPDSFRQKRELWLLETTKRHKIGMWKNVGIRNLVGAAGQADRRSVRQSVFQYETTRVAGRFGNSTPPAIKPPRVGGKFCGQTTNDEPHPTDASLSRISPSCLIATPWRQRRRQRPYTQNRNKELHQHCIVG